MNSLLAQLSGHTARTTLRIAAASLIAVGTTLLLTAPKDPPITSRDDATTRPSGAAIAATPPPIVNDPPAAEPQPTQPMPATVMEATRGSSAQDRTESRPVAIRPPTGDGVLHMYQDSAALLVGPSEREAELEMIGNLLHSRGFRIDRLVDPSLESLSERLRLLPSSFSDQTPSVERRMVIYITGETIDAEARNDVYLRVTDTPASAKSATELRSTAYPLDDLRYLAKDLAGVPLLVVINSGFRALFLEESGEQPDFLTSESFSKPTPAFIVAGSEAGLPDESFPANFVKAFQGPADTDADRHLSAIELARHLPNPAYLARITGEGDQSGPGLVFDLPANAIIAAAPERERSRKPTPASGPLPDRSYAMTTNVPASAVEASTGEPLPPAVTAIPTLGNTDQPAFGNDFALPAKIALHWLPPGQFSLHRASDSTSATGTADENVAIQVGGFWMGIAEITPAQYRAITGKEVAGESDKPLGGVTWEEADAFCKILTENERAIGRVPDGFLYRLPHEVEWEYAAMSGSTRFRKSNLLPVDSWASQLATLPPADTTPQSGPILAMASGLKEWCQDDFFPDPGENRIPTPPHAAKVVRGGLLDTEMIRLSTRFGIYGSTDRLPHLGFRIVLAPEQIALPATSNPSPPLEEGKHFTLDELFEPSPYHEWDRYNKSQILRKAQTAFKELGLYQLSIDGDAGPSTQKALNQYQTDRRLPLTGRLDSATLTALELAEETKKAAPPQGPWWVTRPNSPRSGDSEPPLSAYHGVRGRLKLIKDKEKNTLNQKEYRKFQVYAKWEEVQ